MPRTDKPKYPASLFHLLRKYPVRFCEETTCGTQLTPKFWGGDGKPFKLETLSSFMKRRYCNLSCSGKAWAGKLAAAREKGRARLRADTQPPTLTDAAYGGPPAPPEAVEEPQRYILSDEAAEALVKPVGMVSGESPATPQQNAVIDQLRTVLDRRKGIKPTATPAPENSGEPVVWFRGAMYPARFEEQLETTPYPEKVCAWCGEVLVPKIRGDKLEALGSFKQRVVCNDECARKRNAAKSSRANRKPASESDADRAAKEVLRETAQYDEGLTVDEALHLALGRTLRLHPELLEEMEILEAQQLRRSGRFVLYPGAGEA